MRQILPGVFLLAGLLILVSVTTAVPITQQQGPVVPTRQHTPDGDTSPPSPREDAFNERDGDFVAINVLFPIEEHALIEIGETYNGIFLIIVNPAIVG
ncbi:MAG: hypothetical protein AAFR22_17880, partial [Chloroflexota bacterium]